MWRFGDKQQSSPRWWRDPWFAAALAGIAVAPLARFGLHGLGVVVGPVELSISAMLLLVLLYPVLEELVFRGLIQGQLLSAPRWRRALAPGISLANVVASVLFCLAHLARGDGWWWALAVLVPSLVFGAARDRWRSVVPPVVLHIAYNAAWWLSATKI